MELRALYTHRYRLKTINYFESWLRFEARNPRLMLRKAPAFGTFYMYPADSFEWSMAGSLSKLAGKNIISRGCPGKEQQEKWVPSDTSVQWLLGAYKQFRIQFVWWCSARKKKLFEQLVMGRNIQSIDTHLPGRKSKKRCLSTYHTLFSRVPAKKLYKTENLSRFGVRDDPDVKNHRRDESYTLSNEHKGYIRSVYLMDWQRNRINHWKSMPIFYNRK